MRVDQLSRLDRRGSSDEPGVCVGSGTEAELLAARLVPWRWLSGVPASCHHGELESGPSSKLFISLLLFPTRYREGLSLSLMPAISFTPHPAIHPLYPTIPHSSNRA